MEIINLFMEYNKRLNQMRKHFGFIMFHTYSVIIVFIVTIFSSVIFQFIPNNLFKIIFNSLFALITSSIIIFKHLYDFTLKNGNKRR